MAEREKQFSHSQSSTTMAEAMTSRNFRHLRRSLNCEINMNSLMLNELKSKDNELDDVYHQLGDIKNKMATATEDDVTLGKIRERDSVADNVGSGVAVLLKDIQTALSVDRAVDAYKAIEVDCDKKVDVDRALVMHKIVTLRNALQESSREKEELKGRVEMLVNMDAVSVKQEKNENVIEQNSTGGDMTVEYLTNKVNMLKTIECEKADIQRKLEIAMAENITQRLEGEQKANENADLDEDLRKCRRELIVTRDQNESVTASNATLEKHLVVIKTRLRELKTRLVELEQENEMYQQVIETKSSSHNNNSESTETNLPQKLGGERKDLSAMNAEIESSTTSFEMLQKELDLVTMNNAKLRGQLGKLKADIEEIKVALNRAKGENCLLREEVNTSKKQADDLHGELNAQRRNTVLLNDELEKVKVEKISIEVELTSLKKECDQLQYELNKSTTEKEDIHKELEAMKSERSKLIHKTEAQTNTKLNEIKDTFKSALTKVMTSLEKNASVVSIPTSVKDTNESLSSNVQEGGVPSNSSKERSESLVERREAFNRATHATVNEVRDLFTSKDDYSNISVATQVIALVGKIADEIFAEGSVKLDIQSEIEIVTTITGPSTTTFGALSALSVEKPSERNSGEFLKSLQRGLSEVKSLSKKPKITLSGRLKRKHEVVDEMLNLVVALQAQQSGGGETLHVPQTNA